MYKDGKWNPNPAWVTAEYRLLYYNPMSGFKIVHKDSEEWKQFEASQIPDKGLRYLYDGQGNPVQINPYHKS